MNSSLSDSSKTAFSFPGWSRTVAAAGLLPPGLREGYRQTLSRFLRFCARRQAGPTVAIAREFVELARLEESPGPARLEEWKGALNWYFRRGRAARAGVLKGVPPLARSDMGGPSWEAALIAHLRQRGRSWRRAQGAGREGAMGQIGRLRRMGRMGPMGMGRRRETDEVRPSSLA